MGRQHPPPEDGQGLSAQSRSGALSKVVPSPANASGSQSLPTRELWSPSAPGTHVLPRGPQASALCQGTRGQGFNTPSPPFRATEPKMPLGNRAWLQKPDSTQATPPTCTYPTWGPGSQNPPTLSPDPRECSQAPKVSQCLHLQVSARRVPVCCLSEMPSPLSSCSSSADERASFCKARSRVRGPLPAHSLPSQPPPHRLAPDCSLYTAGEAWGQ